MLLRIIKFFLVFWALYPFAVLFLVHLNYQWISLSEGGRSYSDVHKLPHMQVGLVLGTSSKLSDGNTNPFFESRIDAAAKLYEQGKIDNILVSGSNDGQYYDEPMTMTRALLERGVPQNVIMQDRAGYRTLDSIIRAKEIFGLRELIIISQPFHNKRALYIARHHGIKAYAYEAQSIRGIPQLQMLLREHAARLLVMADIHILDRRPSTLQAGPLIKNE